MVVAIILLLSATLVSWWVHTEQLRRADPGENLPADATPIPLKKIESVPPPDLAKTPISTVIDGSGMPMYVLGSDLTVKYCNSRMYEVLGVRESEILNASVEKLIGAIARLIPDEQRRKRFLEEQAELLRDHKLPPPGAEARVLIDRNKLPGVGLGKAELHICAHAIKSPGSREAEGAFITYRVIPKR